MISITDAQQDMREAYFGGAPGAVSSATTWLIAALVVTLVDPMSGIWTLVLGGMLIFPVSVLLCKVLGRTGKQSKENPLGSLAIEGTIWMILGIVIAIGVAFHKLEWFFPAMLLVIGGRYFTFSTLYGMKLYRAFGATLVIAAFALWAFKAPVLSGAWTGAVIEYAFGLAIFAGIGTKTR